MNNHDRQPPYLRRLAVLFFLVHASGTIIWWLTLLLYPASRTYFSAPGAPDSTLFAFSLPDLAFYILGSMAVGYGLARQATWAWPLLCVHTGAIIYSALYGVGLPLLSGGGWGSLMMFPSAVIQCLIVWLLRPGQRS